MKIAFLPHSFHETERAGALFDAQDLARISRRRTLAHRRREQGQVGLLARRQHVGALDTIRFSSVNAWAAAAHPLDRDAVAGAELPLTQFKRYHLVEVNTCQANVGQEGAKWFAAHYKVFGGDLAF